MNSELPVVERIFFADFYRDGGSYCFCFYSNDGHWYEFLLKTRVFDPTAETSHEPPAIYRESSNHGQLVRNLSWAEGKAFVAQLDFDNERFRELLKIVATEGKK